MQMTTRDLLRGRSRGSCIRSSSARHGPLSTDARVLRVRLGCDGVVASAISRWQLMPVDSGVRGLGHRSRRRVDPEGARVLGEWHTHPHATGSQEPFPRRCAREQTGICASAATARFSACQMEKSILGIPLRQSCPRQWRRTANVWEITANEARRFKAPTRRSRLVCAERVRISRGGPCHRAGSPALSPSGKTHKNNARERHDRPVPQLRVAARGANSDSAETAGRVPAANGSPWGRSRTMSFTRLTHADHSVFALIKALASRPGHVAREYVGRQAKEILRPIRLSGDHRRFGEFPDRLVAASQFFAPIPKTAWRDF